MKTRSVLGYKLRLEVGKHYIAVPATLGDYTPVAKLTITIAEAGNPFGAPVARVDTMPYDKANRFLKAFNNDKTLSSGENGKAEVQDQNPSELRRWRYGCRCVRAPNPGEN